MIERDSTVLPEPDSPTMPSDRPRSSVNETPSTARTRPRGVLNDVRRSVTSSSAPLSGRCASSMLAHSAASRMSKRRATRSPIRLNASTVRNSIMQGKTVAHHAVSIASRFSATISPHDACGGSTL